MRYCAFKAAAHLWQSRKWFALLAMQTILGVALLFYSANSLLQSQSSLNAARQTLQGETLDVSYSFADDVPATNFPVTQDDLSFLETAYEQQADFLYAAFSPQTVVLSQEKAEFLSIYCLFLNDAFFRELFGTAPEENTVYLGENLSEVFQEEQEVDLSKMMYMTQPPVVKWERSEVVVAGGISLPYVSMPASQTTVLAHPAAFAQAENYIPLADCVILPLACLPDAEALPQREGSQAILKIRYRDTVTQNIAPDVLAVLSQRHAQYIYSVEDRYLIMEQAVQETGTETRLLLVMALGLLLSLLLSTAGILSILLARRKQQLAICLAYGATRGAILGEAAWEMLFVFAPSAVLGTLLGWGACLAVNVSVAGITFVCAPMVVAIAVALCVWLTGSKAGFQRPGRLLRTL